MPAATSSTSLDPAKGSEDFSGLSFTKGIRDVLTPLCADFEAAVLSLDPEEIRQVARDLPCQPVVLPPQVGNSRFFELFSLLDSDAARINLGIKSTTAIPALIEQEIESVAQLIPRVLKILDLRSSFTDKEILSIVVTRLGDLKLFKALPWTDICGPEATSLDQRQQEYLARICSELDSYLHNLHDILTWLNASGSQPVPGIVSILKQVRTNAAFKDFFDIRSSYPQAHFTGVLWASLPKNTERLVFDPFSSLTAPVGAYGEGFAKELYLTTYSLMILARNLTLDASREIARNHPALVGVTARGREALAFDTKKHFEDSISRGLCEGILTISQSLSLLYAERIPGHYDPHKLLSPLLRESNRLARLAPPGVIGPMVLAGRYFKNSIEPVNRDPRLSKEFKSYLRFVQDLYRSEESEEEDSFRGVGCPISYPMFGEGVTGLQRVTNAFSHVHSCLLQID